MSYAAFSTYNLRSFSTENEIRHDANVGVTGGNTGCRNDNMRW